jgi:hypothetical protein
MLDQQEDGKLMKKQVLFIHGGGQGAHEGNWRHPCRMRWSAAYDMRYPKMPDEDSHVYEAALRANLVWIRL